MAFLSKLRARSVFDFRQYATSSAKAVSKSPSEILSGDPKAILTCKEKTLAAINLMKTETNPEKIINICRAASLTPDVHLDRLAFSSAIHRLSKMNYFDGIRVYLDELKRRPDLKNERFIAHAIILYGQAGMLPNAITTFEQMHQMGIPRTVKSLNALLFSCILAKNCDEAKRIFTDFPTTYNIEPDTETYNYMIRAFCEAGESISGYSIVAEMGRKSCKPNTTTFTNLLEGFYKEDKSKDVEKVLKMMTEHGIKHGLSVYNMRIECLCKLGKSDEGKALLDGMRKKLITPRTKTYSSLIHGFCKEGKFEDAKKVHKDMVNQGCLPDAYCCFTLISFLTQCGDYETALDICKHSLMRKWFPNFTTMKSLVEGLLSISKVDEAKELVKQVKEKFPKHADQWKETEEKLST